MLSVAVNQVVRPLVAVMALLVAVDGGKVTAPETAAAAEQQMEPARKLLNRFKRLKTRKHLTKPKVSSSLPDTPSALARAKVGRDASLQPEYHHTPTSKKPVPPSPTPYPYGKQSKSRKGGGKGGKGSKSSKSGGGNGGDRDGFSDAQTCALFDHYFNFEICPKSHFYCPYVGWEKDVQKRRLSYYDVEDDGTQVECLSVESFFTWCEQYRCEMEQVDQCINIIKGCCSGWCDSGLTLKERCDAFEIVSESSSAGNPEFVDFYCDVYENVICPDKNLRSYICDNASEGSWEDFCNTYSDNKFKYHGQENAATVEQIFQHCMTPDVFDCCCGPVPAPTF